MMIKILRFDGKLSLFAKNIKKNIENSINEVRELGRKRRDFDQNPLLLLWDARRVDKLAIAAFFCSNFEEFD